MVRNESIIDGIKVREFSFIARGIAISTSAGFHVPRSVPYAIAAGRRRASIAGIASAVAEYLAQGPHHRTGVRDHVAERAQRSNSDRDASRRHAARLRTGAATEGVRRPLFGGYTAGVESSGNRP